MTGTLRDRKAAVLMLTLVLAATAGAQEDRAAGLFTRARKLPLVSQSLEVEIGAGEATVRLVQAFQNDGSDEGQADYRLHLPEGASVSAFGFWQGDRFLAAELQEREAARSAHGRAAAEHRATGLLQLDGHVAGFSVYPLSAGEVKRVEATIVLPVVTERGRSHVALPIDWFLGDRPVKTPVVVHILSEEPLAGFGVAGLRVAELEHGAREARFAFSAESRVEVWFAEEVPPLLAAGEAVPLDDGTAGIQLRLMLNDASEYAAPVSRVVLLVDVSHSMRRRTASIRRVLERLASRSDVPVEAVRVGETARPLGRLEDAGRMVEELFAESTYGSSWQVLVEAARALGCSDPEVRCLAVTDPQLPGLGGEREDGLRMLFLADPYEVDAFAKVLGPGAPVYQPEVDPAARLDVLADAGALPVITVERAIQDGRELDLMRSGPRWAPEGGMLRLYAVGTSASPVEVEGWIDSSPVAVTVPLDAVSPVTVRGRSLRRSVHREVLARWVGEWRRTHDASLRARIVELSLREGIPTEFTALHAADPRLSLGRFRPGDPVLTVPAGPDVVSVTAWYPFGRHAVLARDPEDGTFSDRFLVPRGWPDGGYRVRVCRRYADGHVEEDSVWYRLDSRGPDAVLSLDPTGNLLVIDTGEATPEIGAVLVFTGDARQLTLAPLGHRWTVPLARLDQRFTLVLRDRATNRTVIRCRLREGRLELEPIQERPSRLTAPDGATVPEGLTAARDGLALIHGRLWLDLPERTVTGRLRGVPRSLGVTCLFQDGEDLLAGTDGGDIIRFAGDVGGGELVAEVLRTRYPDHPVTGFAPLGGGRVLVGVLGGGLFQVEAGRLTTSPLSVGTRFVTAVRSFGGTIFVGTSGRGLWRIVRGRPVRTRFPESVVTGLGVAGGRLEVRSIAVRYLRRGCDRFEVVGPVLLEPGSPSPDLTAGVVHRGELVVGRLQGGIAVVTPSGIEPADTGLGVDGGRVNDLASFAGALWVASEGGLYRVAGDEAEQVLAFPVHDLAAGGDALAAATAVGLWVVAQDGETRRWDVQAGTGRESLAAVTWWRGTVIAGGRDGLWRFSGPGAGMPLGPGAALAAGNVAALFADDDGVLIGTADRGVYRFDGERVRPVAGLGDLWVAPRGISRAGEDLWIGTVGMPPVRLSPGGRVQRIPVPARDVNRAVEGPGGRLQLLTSGGLVTLDP